MEYAQNFNYLLGRLGKPATYHFSELKGAVSFFLCWVGYALEGSAFSLNKCDVILAACFSLRGRGTHIDLLWFLFLVDRICPLMQEHFLFLRLNKGLTFLQSAFSI